MLLQAVPTKWRPCGVFGRSDPVTARYRDATAPACLGCNRRSRYEGEHANRSCRCDPHPARPLINTRAGAPAIPVVPGQNQDAAVTQGRASCLSFCSVTPARSDGRRPPAEPHGEGTVEPGERTLAQQPRPRRGRGNSFGCQDSPIVSLRMRMGNQAPEPQRVRWRERGCHVLGVLLAAPPATFPCPEAVPGLRTCALPIPWCACVSVYGGIRAASPAKGRAVWSGHSRGRVHWPQPGFSAAR